MTGWQVLDRWIKTLAFCGLAFGTFNALAAVPPVVDDRLFILVGAPAGDPPDRVARLLAHHLEPHLGVPVVVENRSGAGGRLAAQQVAEAGSEDNVLLFSAPGPIVIAPVVFRNLGYDALESLLPITLAVRYDFGLAVSPNGNLASIDDLQVWAYTNPKAFNIGVPGAGTLAWFIAYLIDQQLPEPAQLINYRGSAPMLADLMTDRVALGVDTLESLQVAVAADKAKILATSGLERNPDFPDVPTFEEAGLGVEARGWFGFFASANMSPGRRNELGERIAQTVRQPEVAETLRRLGYDPVGLGPTSATQEINLFRQKWVPIIRSTGYEVAY